MATTTRAGAREAVMEITDSWDFVLQCRQDRSQIAFNVDIVMGRKKRHLVAYGSPVGSKRRKEARTGFIMSPSSSEVAEFFVLIVMEAAASFPR